MGRRELARAARVCAFVIAFAAAALPATAEARYAHRTLHTGSHGRDVKLLQHYLTRAGFRAAADGRFGRGTRRAQRHFERSVRHRRNGRASRSEQRLVRRLARDGRGGATRYSGGAAYDPAAGNPTAKAVIGPDHRTAIAPDGAPQQVKEAIAAANRITREPYHYGGGHGRWEDSGYDCSGAVSYALHGGGLLDSPLDSSSFESWGDRGRGRWITLYANSGHA